MDKLKGLEVIRQTDIGNIFMNLDNNMKIMQKLKLDKKRKVACLFRGVSVTVQVTGCRPEVELFVGLTIKNMALRQDLPELPFEQHLRPAGGCWRGQCYSFSLSLSLSLFPVSPCPPLCRSKQSLPTILSALLCVPCWPYASCIVGFWLLSSPDSLTLALFIALLHPLVFFWKWHAIGPSNPQAASQQEMLGSTAVKVHDIQAP